MTNTLPAGSGAKDLPGLRVATPRGSCFVEDSGSGPVASSLQLLL